MQEQSPPTVDDITPAPKSVGVHPLERVLRKLADARNKLVDRNLRNRLISTPLESSRTKSMRVWGSASEQIYATLLSQKKQMTFLPIPDEGVDEAATETQTALVEPDVGAIGENVLQTKLTKTNLEKKLKSLFYESKEYEEEQGVNVLYIALGFLKWYEDANSDIAKYAPLVLLPVELSREGAKDRYKLKLRDEDSGGEMGVIRQEINKKRNHRSVRKLLKEAGLAIQQMKPVFLMSPLSVAQFIPPGSLMFDLVIIDEASQVKPEDALGAIARAKQIVTVGDDKQLPPTNFFNRLTDDELDVEQDEDDYSFGDVESPSNLSGQ